VIDRELYLPQGWTDDPARCRAAGVPDQVGFATKPELARVVPQRALGAGVPARLGDRRRGPWRRPGAARLAGGPPDALRAGGQVHCRFGFAVRWRTSGGPWAPLPPLARTAATTLAVAESQTVIAS
jgi:DDE superfamily endonuclease